MRGAAVADNAPRLDAVVFFSVGGGGRGGIPNGNPHPIPIIPICRQPVSRSVGFGPTGDRGRIRNIHPTSNMALSVWVGGWVGMVCVTPTVVSVLRS